MKSKTSVILLLMLPLFSMGQRDQDTTFISASVRHATKAYHASISKQLNIYNGRGYKILPLTTEQHPYFLSDDWLMGSIVYESDEYREIPLQYDLLGEIVILENPFNGAKMELVNSKIQRFEVDGHSFVKLSNGNSLPSGMPDGFYELLYNGHLKLYAKRKKDPQKRIDGNTLSYEYDEKNKYFLFRENHYYPVTGKKSVIKALESNTKLPKPPKTKVDPASANKVEDKLIQLVKFYDSQITSL